jgi:thermostable 8-oxoguanine DNA glycosylase
VDPNDITDYERSESELQLVLLFWIAAAGKKASSAARSLESLMIEGSERFKTQEPFEIVRRFGGDLPCSMRRHGMGCYRNKAATMTALAHSDINLKTCDVSLLESIKGIGPKTSRCFIIHSRRDARHAGLDTHILKYMRELGFDVPKSTPSGKRYLILESAFLELADASGMTVAEFDLQIWKSYSGKFGKIKV